MDVVSNIEYGLWVKGFVKTERSIRVLEALDLKLRKAMKIGLKELQREVGILHRYRKASTHFMGMYYSD